MKILRIFLTVFIILQSCGCDWIYRKLHKEGAEEKKIIGEVDLMANNETVKEIQILLMIYGYNPGKIDGVLGAGTRNAVARFQKDNNLNPSRFVDQQTWNTLMILKDKGFVEKNRLNVKLVQKLLKKAGFNPGKTDGLMGDNTINAVKDFQKSQGLKMDGKIGYQTLTKLSEFIDVQKN
jgi:peptidoglycan hydrolase-like protein with peptidoglycan-binding domain